MPEGNLTPEARAWIETQLKKRGMDRTPDNAVALWREYQQGVEAEPQPRSVIRGQRPVFLAAGGMFGGAAGLSATGGNPMGMVAGSVAGTEMGLQANEGLARIEEGFLQGKGVGQVGSELIRNSTPSQMLQSQGELAPEAAREAYLDVGFSMGGEVAALGVRWALRKTTGFGAEAVSRLDEAKVEGIPTGLQEVSEAPWVRGMQQTIGAFPILNKPFLEAAERRSAALVGPAGQGGGRVESLTWSLGPVVGMARSGKRIVSAADEAFAAWKDSVDLKYQKAYKAAEAAGAIVPTDATRNAAKAIRSEIENLPPVRVAEGGKIVERPAKIALDPRVESMLKELENLAESGATIEQHKNLGKRLVKLIDDLKDAPGTRRHVIRLKAALEDDMMNISAPGEVRTLFNLADRAFMEGQDFFASTVGNDLRKVNRNFGEIQVVEQGIKNADQVARIIFNTDSPTAIKKLRALMFRAGARGQEAYRGAVASYVDDIFSKAYKEDKNSGITYLSFSEMRRRFGLDRPRSNEYQVLQELLRGTGVSVGDIERFIRVAERSFANGIPASAQMMRRRVVLGGTRALTTSFLPTGVAPKDESFFSSATRTALGFALFAGGGRKVARGLSSAESLTGPSLSGPASKAKGPIRTELEMFGRAMRPREGIANRLDPGQTEGLTILDKGLLGEVMADPRKIRLVTKILDLKTTPVEQRRALRRLAIIMPSLFTGEGIVQIMDAQFEQMQEENPSMTSRVADAARSTYQFMHELVRSSENRQKLIGRQSR